MRLRIAAHAHAQQRGQRAVVAKRQAVGPMRLAHGQVLARLQATAHPVNPSSQIGAGRLDVGAAVAGLGGDGTAYPRDPDGVASARR